MSEKTPIAAARSAADELAKHYSLKLEDVTAAIRSMETTREGVGDIVSGARDMTAALSLMPEGRIELKSEGHKITLEKTVGRDGTVHYQTASEGAEEGGHQEAQMAA